MVQKRRKLENFGNIFKAVLILLIITFAYTAYGDWWVAKKTTDWQARAQVAANPQDMQGYLNSALAGMEDLGIANGHSALVFKTPENNMTLIVRSLETCIQRCDDIKRMDPSSPEYQTALTDLRQTIAELDLHAAEAWWIRGKMLPLRLLMGLSAIAAFILLFYGLLSLCPRDCL